MQPPLPVLANISDFSNYKVLSKISSSRLFLEHLSVVTLDATFSSRIVNKQFFEQLLSQNDTIFTELGRYQTNRNNFVCSFVSINCDLFLPRGWKDMTWNYQSSGRPQKNRKELLMFHFLR